MAKKNRIAPQIGVTGVADFSFQGSVNQAAEITLSGSVSDPLVLKGNRTVVLSSTQFVVDSVVDFDNAEQDSLVLSGQLVSTESSTNFTTVSYLIDNIAIVDAGSGGVGEVSVYDEGVFVGQSSEFDFIGPAVEARLQGNRVEVETTATGSSDFGFLPIPDLFDETDATYFYYGWNNVNGNWLIRRGNRLTAQKQNATISTNSAYANLSAAWPNRNTLNYS